MALITFGASVDSDADIDISSLATSDWAVFKTGGSPATPAERKSGGGSTVSSLSSVAGAIDSYTGDTRTVTWTGGTPTASGGSLDVVYCSASGSAGDVSVSLPAGTATRTAYVAFTHYDGQTIRCTVTLSDGSAGPSFTTIAGSTPDGADSNGVFTFDYASGSDGQTATAKLTFDAVYSSGAIIGMQAAGWSLASVSGNTGTLAWTEADDLSASSGSVIVSGVAAWTEANDAMVSTGTVRTAGPIVFTEANDTNAASGGVQNTGSAVWTETADTHAATGSITSSDTSGGLAWTEEDDAHPAAGGVAAAGALDWTETDDASAATGTITQPPSGAIAWIEQDDGFAITGISSATPAAASVEVVQTVGRTIRHVTHQPLLQRIMEARRAERFKPARERAAKRAKVIEVQAAQAVLDGGSEASFKTLMKEWLEQRPVLPVAEPPSQAFMAQVAFRIQQMEQERRALAALAAQQDDEEAVIALLLA